MDDETSNIHLSLSLFLLLRLSSRAAGLEIELFGCRARAGIEVEEGEKKNEIEELDLI